MTQQPPRCRYDRDLGERVTRHHADDCPHLDQCDGCQPCLEPHCSVCGREHLDDNHPNTCHDCVASIRDDLNELGRDCRQLRSQAAHAANDGKPWAAAPIPGATAMVLVGPSVDPDTVTRGRHYSDDHRRSDPIPPLAVLAAWEDTWRSWLQQPAPGRASVSSAIDYLDTQLTDIAQASLRLNDDGHVTRPPEFPEFARAIGRLRAQVEHTLHDEQAPDRGVECFECGARLVRRHRDPKRCTHQTPARTHFAERFYAQPAAREWLQVLASYGLRPTPGEQTAALGPTPVEVAAARMPCPRCDQGGLADPTPGISWECPSCRMHYTPGEYATAVRRDLLDRSDDDGYGWTDIVLAAEAASTLTGRLIPASTVRRWMDRGRVTSCCAWRPGECWGQRLVYWPDVADRATRPARRSGNVA